MNAIVPASLDGEIILPGDCITVRAALHPLRTSHLVLAMPAGLTIAEIVERARVEAGEVTRLKHGLLVELSTDLGAERVPPELWHRVRVKPGVSVILRAVARGGGGSFLKSILMLAVFALAFFAVPIIAPALGISTALAQGALVAIGSLVLNVLFPTRPPQLKNDKTKTTYSIGGGKNVADPNGPISSILGKIRVQPKDAANAYTELHGSDQYLRMLLCWGYGPLLIEEIKIGETAIEEFDDYEIQTYFGYPDDPAPSLYPSQVIEQQLNVDINEDAGWQTRTTTNNLDEVSLDFTFPQGLIKIKTEAGKKSTGKQDSWTVKLRVEYRDADADEADPWTFFGSLSVTAKTQEVIRKTVRGAVPRGNDYDFRVKKTSADYGGDSYQVNEVCTWTALRGMRNDAPLHFPYPLAITAIRIKATDQLNGVIDDLNGICTSRVLAFDEATNEWVPDTPSQNPADLFRHVLQNPANPEQKSDDEIGIAALEEWHRYCTLQGFKFNQERDFVVSGDSTLEDICAAGRAVLSKANGVYSVIWDEEGAPIVQHFTPRNSWDFSFEREYRELPHALNATFINERRDYLQDQRYIYADGYDTTTATRFEDIEFPGVTDPDLVWRHGRYHYAQVLLQPDTFTLTADAETIICTRGDRVRVTHDVAMIGLAAGRVKAVSGSIVTVDEQVLMDPDKTYGARFRTANGSVFRNVVTAGGYNNQIQLSGTGTAPGVGDMFTFGELGTDSSIFRVLRIKPGADYSAVLTLVNDAPAIYLADQGEIPDFDSNVTLPPDPATIRPFNLRILEGTSDVNDGYVPTATLLWAVAVATNIQQFEVQEQFAEGGGAFGPSRYAASRSVVFKNLAPGTHTFRVRSLFKDGTASTWATLTTYVQSTERPPQDVDGFVVAVLGDQATFSWLPALEAVAYLELRYSPATAGANWTSAVTAVPQAGGTSVQTALQTGTYLAKFVSYSGVYSTNAALIVVEDGGIGSLNVVEEVFDMNPFGGTHDGTEVDEGSGSLQIAGVDGAGWDAEEGQATGVYELADITDLGEVFTSRVTAEVVAGGVSLVEDMFARPDFFAVPDFFGADASNWAVTIEMSTTRDDPAAVDGEGAGTAVWTDWAGLIIGDYTARAYRWRLRLESFAFGVTPRLTLFHASIDMPDRIEGDQDIVIPVAGRRVNFTPNFRELRSVAITGQGFATGDYIDWGNKDVTGFDIVIRDAAGDPIERSVDWMAKGFGRKIG